MADNNTKLTLDELAQDYGFAAAFFGQDPELHALIDQATKEQWSVAKFQAKFINTNWYRSHQAATRQWDELVSRDPATAAAQIQQTVLKLSNMASQAGITISADRLNQMAHDSLMFGLNDEQLQQAIGFEYQYQPGTSTGTAATDEDQIRKSINDYGLTISDDTVGGWIKNMLAGSYTIDNVNGLLKNMAMSKYPGLNQYLSQGLTVRDVADPYIQSYSQLLETPAANVQLSDPLIQKALQGTQLPKPGTTPGAQPTGPQSLYDFENSLRQDPRWLKTKNAQDSLQQAGMSVLRDWGLYS